MSSLGLFLVGSVITLLVAASIGLLIWGAIMDGRYQSEQRAAEDETSARLLPSQPGQPVRAA